MHATLPCVQIDLTDVYFLVLQGVPLAHGSARDQDGRTARRRVGCAPLLGGGAGRGGDDRKEASLIDVARLQNPRNAARDPGGLSAVARGAAAPLEER